MAIKKKLLIQLPKSKPYFSFSSNLKVLNFVRNDLSTKIIQVNNQGHMTIPGSSLPIKFSDVAKAEIFGSVPAGWESRKSMFPHQVPPS
jgi:hypothetical protein